MDQISIYLEKFKKGAFKEEKVLGVVKNVLEEMGFEIEKKEINIKNEKIRINKLGPEKSEIFIKRKIIEKKIKEKLDKEINQKTNRKII